MATSSAWETTFAEGAELLADPNAMVDRAQGGFTKSDRPVLPVISQGPYGYQHVNVAQQRRDPDSC